MMPKLSSSTLQSSFVRLQRAFTPTLTDKKEKKRGTTMAIRNAGESADMKVITLNKLHGRRTMKCLENPHYA